MISRRSFSFAVLLFLFVMICIVFFLFGRISMYWKQDNHAVIHGVEFVNTEEIEGFLDILEHYEKPEDIVNDITIYESLQLVSEEKEQEQNILTAQFVASARGKYYYPIDSKQAQSLSESNRIYFQTEIEAQSAGYIAK